MYQAVISAVEEQIPNTSGAFRPITVVTKPGTVTHVVLPGASSMRGVTGLSHFRRRQRRACAADPGPNPGGGRGRKHARDLLRAATGRRARSSTTSSSSEHGGRCPTARRQRRPVQPVRDCGEHPRRGCRVGVPDPDRALRSRARLAAAPGGTAEASRSSARGATSCPRRACRSARTGSGTARTDSPAARTAAPRRTSSRTGGAAAYPADVLDDDRRAARASTTAWPAAEAGGTRSSATRPPSRDDVRDEKVSARKRARDCTASYS